MKSSNSFCKIKVVSQSKRHILSIFYSSKFYGLKIAAKMIPKSQNHHFCYSSKNKKLFYCNFLICLYWDNFLNMQNFSALVMWKLEKKFSSVPRTLNHLNEKILNFFWLGIWKFLHFWNIGKLSSNFCSDDFWKFGRFHSAVVKGLNL